MPKSKPSPKPTETGQTPQVRWWVKALVFLHVFAITSWALPRAGTAVLNGKAKPLGTEWILWFNDSYLKTSPVKLYVLSTGVWQSWDMFSPNPSNTDIYADAEVHYKDGTVATYNYPRMYKLPIVTKYIKERYRKFFEHANNDAYLWPHFVERIKTLTTNDPNNPPVRIVLHRHWYTIPKLPPFSDYLGDLWSAVRSGHLSSKVLLPDNPALPEKYNDYVYYEFPPPPPEEGQGQ